MITDLDVVGVDLWKFVDTTLSETVRKHEDYVHDFTRQPLTENFVLNGAKCKELSFGITEPFNVRSYCHQGH